MKRLLLAPVAAAILAGCAVHSPDDFGQPGPRIQVARSIGLPPAHSWRWQAIPMGSTVTTEGLDAHGEAFWIRVAGSYSGNGDWTIYGPLKPGQRVDVASALGHKDPYEIGVQEMLHSTAPQPPLPRPSLHELPLPVRIAVPGIMIGRLPATSASVTTASTPTAAPAPAAAAPAKASEPAPRAAEPARHPVASEPAKPAPSASAAAAPNSPAPVKLQSDADSSEAKGKSESPKPESVAAAISAAPSSSTASSTAADAPINAGVEIDPQRLPGETNCVDPVRAYNRESFPVVVTWRTRSWQSGATRPGVCKLAKLGREESIVLRPAREPGSLQRLFCGRVQGASYTCVDHRSAEDVKVERAPTPAVEPARRLPVATAQ